MNGEIIEIFKNNVVCPRCNGNGLIMHAIISKSGHKFFICDECDAMWDYNNVIELKTFVQFQIWAENNQITFREYDILDEKYSWYERMINEAFELLKPHVLWQKYEENYKSKFPKSIMVQTKEIYKLCFDLICNETWLSNEEMIHKIKNLKPELNKTAIIRIVNKISYQMN